MIFKDGSEAVAVWKYQCDGVVYLVAAKTRKRACEIERGVNPEWLTRVKNLWARREGSIQFKDRVLSED